MAKITITLTKRWRIKSLKEEFFKALEGVDPRGYIAIANERIIDEAQELPKGTKVLFLEAPLLAGSS